MTIGSDNAADCITVNEVCTVTTETDKQTLNPPGGARVKPDSVITVTCDSNYGLEVNASVTFRCDQTAYPTCYATCSLAAYTEDLLEERFIHDNIDSEFLVHNQQIKVTCQSGYEFEEDVPVRTYTCNDGTLPEFDSCQEISGSAVLTTVVVCVIVLGVAIIFLFLFILVQWRKKKTDAYNVKQVAGAGAQPDGSLEMGGRPGPSTVVINEGAAAVPDSNIYN